MNDCIRRDEAWHTWKMAEAMQTSKAYPDDDDFISVAKALISKHSCLTEPGLQLGWYDWKKRLKFKMANNIAKLWKVGCEDVAVNGGKQSKGNPEEDYSSKNVNWPKRGETNYLLNFPEPLKMQGKSLQMKWGRNCQISHRDGPDISTS